MLQTAAAVLTESQREALSVAAAVLVALTLVVFIQGRIVDEHVDPPARWRAYLVAIEILSSGVLFIPAAVGVYCCLYYLASDRAPEGGDRAIIESALLTTAITAFVLTIARRALPAIWPQAQEHKERRALTLMRAGVLVSVVLVVVSGAAAVTLRTGGVFILVGVLAVMLVIYMSLMSRIDSRVGREEAWLAAWLGRGAWTRVQIRPVEGGFLDGMTDLPVAFVRESSDSARELWMSNAGLERIRLLLKERDDGRATWPVLRWRGRKRAEVLFAREPSGGAVHVANTVIIQRHDSRLFPVEPALGLVEPAECLDAGDPREADVAQFAG